MRSVFLIQIHFNIYFDVRRDIVASEVLILHPVWAVSIFLHLFQNGFATFWDPYDLFLYMYTDQCFYCLEMCTLAGVKLEKAPANELNPVAVIIFLKLKL